MKRFERIGNHYLQVNFVHSELQPLNIFICLLLISPQICKQLGVFSNEKTSKFKGNLDNLREIMGVMQHHDAITGTEKQYVAEDYARLLQIGIDKCSENIKKVLNQLSHSKIRTKYTFDYENCADLNISSCEITENSNQFMITLYNPLSHSTFQYVRLPVKTGEYEVRGPQNISISSQLVPIPVEIQSLSYRRSKAKMELVFLADELPPLGYKSYFVQRKSEPRATQSQSIAAIPNIDHNKSAKPFTIGGKYLKLTFDQNGLLASAANENVEMNVRQNFYIYRGFTGDNAVPEKRSSGAYIFRPETGALEIADHAKIRVFRGHLVDEVHQVYNELKKMSFQLVSKSTNGKM